MFPITINVIIIYKIKYIICDFIFLYCSLAKMINGLIDANSILSLYRYCYLNHCIKLLIEDLTLYVKIE